MRERQFPETLDASRRFTCVGALKKARDAFIACEQVRNTPAALIAAVHPVLSGYRHFSLTGAHAGDIAAFNCKASGLVEVTEAASPVAKGVFDVIHGPALPPFSLTAKQPLQNVNKHEISVLVKNSTGSEVTQLVSRLRLALLLT